MDNIPSFEEIPQRIATLSDQISRLTQDMGSLSQQINAKKLPAEPESFIGIDEACKLVHLAKPTIYKMARKGLIPYYKPSKELLFRRTELIKWVEESHRDGKLSIEEIAKVMTVGNRRKPKRWD